VCCLFGLPVATTKRIVFNEITKPALERAIQSPQLLNMHAVHAQIARQALDMLVGFKITPTLWSHVAGSSLQRGAVQTPALRLIYDNQRAIDAAAEGTIVYETVGYFTKLNLKYELNRGHDVAEACSHSCWHPPNFSTSFARRGAPVLETSAVAFHHVHCSSRPATN
jgi:DNA topoisomerase-1